MQKLFEATEESRDLILEAEKHIWNNPETGYREHKTSEYLAEKFSSLGYEVKTADGIPGFYADFDSGREGAFLLITAELDSVLCPEHPESDKATGAVHACGHNAQCASLLGVAAAIAKTHGDGFCGKIRFCAVPAEELIELEYRKELVQRGVIEHLCGKREFLSRGYFDGIDLAFMVHITQGGYFAANDGAVGCIAKNITYHGKASHAGGNPEDGINALYAANCGINAANALRETFKERDIIRFHPIITSGGAAVNAIPETVKIESYVRGKSFGAIAEANAKINRALAGGALSLGANVEICDVMGYAPLTNDSTMTEVARDALKLARPNDTLYYSQSTTSGSTDMGDLSCIMPVVHPYAPGAVGTSHGRDYKISDPVLACVENAKWQVATAKLLLENGSAMAKKITAGYKPAFASAKEYLAYAKKLESSGERIEYAGDKAIIKIQ